jgi:hypothetical protein
VSADPILCFFCFCSSFADETSKFFAVSEISAIFLWLHRFLPFCVFWFTSCRSFRYSLLCFGLNDFLNGSLKNPPQSSTSIGLSRSPFSFTTTPRSNANRRLNLSSNSPCCNGRYHRFTLGFGGSVGRGSVGGRYYQKLCTKNRRILG